MFHDSTEEKFKNEYESWHYTYVWYNPITPSIHISFLLVSEDRKSYIYSSVHGNFKDKDCMTVVAVISHALPVCLRHGNRDIGVH